MTKLTIALGAIGGFGSIGINLIKKEKVNYKRAAVCTGAGIASGYLLGKVTPTKVTSSVIKDIIPTEAHSSVSEASCNWAKYNGTSSAWFDKDAWQYFR